MKAPVEIPDGLMAFTVNGVTFALDPIEAHRAIATIERATEGLRNFEYADRFAEWVAGQTEGAVTLTTAQADWLIDHVRVEYVAAKKAVVSRLNSLSSTAPAPAPSTPDSD